MRAPAQRERIAPEPGPRIDYSEAQPDPGDAPEIAVDQRVEHPIFGAGRIMEVVGAGAAAKATIRFERAGVKVIKLKYAQLRLLD
jgi:DNA helicase-2/ATP-dependent DNA helicase PcrA